MKNQKTFPLSLFLFVLALAVLLLPTASQAQGSFDGAMVPIAISGEQTPHGVAVDGFGNLFFADTGGSRVVEIPVSGGPMVTVGTGLSYPIGVAVDAAGDVFISDSGNNRVVEVPAGGGSQITIGGAYALSNPDGIAVDAAGDVFVADSGNARVVEVPAGGGPESILPFTGLVLPYAVAVDTAGDLYVADSGSGTVVELSRSVSAWGLQNTLATGFSSPKGIAVDSAFNVFVADSGNNQVVELVGGSRSPVAVGTFWNFETPLGLAVDTSGDLFITDSYINGRQMELQTTNVKFGAHVVGVAGTTNIPLNFTVNSGTTIGSYKIFMLGNESQDFTDAGDSTCKAQTYTKTTQCVIDVKFTPLAPGLRQGAVSVFDGSGNPLGDVVLSGAGTGPQVAFSAPLTAAQGTSSPLLVNATAVRTDAQGNLFMAIAYDLAFDANSGSVIEFKSNGAGGYAAPVTVTSGIGNLIDLALDGGGNLWAVSQADAKQDANSGALLLIQKTASGWAVPLTVLSELNFPRGVVVNAAGDVFLVIEGDLKVVEIPRSSLQRGGPITPIALASGLPYLQYLAVDGSGNLFVTSAWDAGGDDNSGSLMALPKNATGYSSPVTLASGISIPQGLSVDANDDVFLVTNGDANEDQSTGTILEVPFNGSSYSAPVTLATGIGYPTGIALDSSGNIFVADSVVDQAFELPRATPPTLTFASTAEGATSSDSPKTVTVENIGNASLVAVSPGLVVNGANFAQVAGAPVNCTPTFTLAPGTSCNLSISFTPKSTGPLSSTAVLTDNTLNASPSASQSIALLGTAPTQAATPVITPGSGTYTTTQSVTISDATAGATIYYTTNGTTPTTSSFVYTGPITVSSSETIEAIAVASGYTNSAVASAAYSLNLPTAATPVITPGSGTYTTTQSVTISDATAGATIYYATNGITPTTSSFVYTGPFIVSSSETIQAIAVASGYTNSAVASAAYTLNLPIAGTPMIYTVAGNGTFGYSGDGGPAVQAELGYIEGVVSDSAGNVYISDTADSVVRKISAGTGTITTEAGTGIAGYSGDNGPGTSAQLNYPTSLALDSSGNLYIVDQGNGVVRKLNTATGVITSFSATNGGYKGMVFDSSGNLYVGAFCGVQKIAAGSRTITWVAGYNCGYGGDGGQATSAHLSGVMGLALDHASHLFIADSNNRRIRMVNLLTGVITTVAGNGTATDSGDGGQATSAGLFYPQALALDNAGNLYIAENDSVVRKVDTSGTINRFAGLPGLYQDAGDGGPANSAGLYYPFALAFDSAGDLYIGEDMRVRMVTPSAVPPTTPTATPSFSLAAGSYSGPQSVTITESTPGAAVYISLDGGANWTGYAGKVSMGATATLQAYAAAPGYLRSAKASAAYTITSLPAAVITTVAGTGVEGMSGNGILATSANLGFNQAIAVDRAGNAYLADTQYNIVWKVAAGTGIITPYAGNGTADYSGDGGPATSASLNYPISLAVDGSGNLFITDSNNSVIRKVSPSGTITTYAGNGNYDYTGDGGPASSAALYYPYGIALDGSGNLYIADTSNCVVRKVTASTGIITTVAGAANSNTTCTTTGDGGQFSQASLNYPSFLTFDSSGNLYIMENYGTEIRKVTTSTGIITTVAGTGVYGYTGDGGPATRAEINANDDGFVVDPLGNLFISDGSVNGIREVSASTGIITTIAGNGVMGSYGDGGPALGAEMNYPAGMVFDSTGNLYVVDSNNYRVRKITFSAKAAVTPAINWAPPAPLPYGTPLAAILNATATYNSSLVSGSFSYTATPPGGSLTTVTGSTILPAGAYTLTATFTPANTTDFVSGGRATVSLTVYNPAPLTLNPSTLSFGNQVENAASPAHLVYLSNPNPVSVSIASIGISGTGSASFGDTTTCGATLAANSTCSISVTFTPASLSAFSANLTVTANDSGSSHVIPISGAGIVPTTLSTTSLAFGNVAQSTTSPVKIVTLWNNSQTTPLTVSLGVTPGSGFAIDGSTTCPNGSNLAPGASCTVGVTLTPTPTGPYTGTLTFTTSAANSPQTVTLSGSGISPTTLSTTSLAFGNVAQSTSSPVRTVTLWNNSPTTTLTVSLGVTPGSGFAIDGSTTCPNGGALAAGANCTVGVKLTPTSSGPYTGTLTFTTSAANSPQTVALSGTGISPTTLSTTSLAFGNVAQNSTSPVKIVTLWNNSTTTALTVSLGVTPGSGFAIDGSTTCPNGSTLAAGANCNVGVKLTPTAGVAYTGMLTFTTSASNSPQTVALSGSGIVPTTLSTTSLAFGNVAENTPSPVKKVILWNNSQTAPLTVSLGVTPGSGFAIDGSTTCPNGSTLAPGANCTVGVTLTPSAAGPYNGTLTFTTSAANSPQTVALSGTGIAPTVLSTTTLAFGSVVKNTTSPVARVILWNNSQTTPLTVSLGVTPGSGFAIDGSTTCPSGSTLAPGANCTVGVTFRPPATGPYTGTLTFTTSAANSPQTVALSGRGL
jgi:sugar lactone lactonase YvrE